MDIKMYTITKKLLINVYETKNLLINISSNKNFKQICGLVQIIFFKKHEISIQVRIFLILLCRLVQIMIF